VQDRPAKSSTQALVWRTEVVEGLTAAVDQIDEVLLRST
jgi:hypothetical protein